MFPKTQAEAEAAFGKIEMVKGVLTWKDEVKHMAVFMVPNLFPNWISTASKKPVKKIYLNKVVHAPLLAALTEIDSRGLNDELVSFDGGWCLRAQRGSTKFSTHCWGLAFDINASTNQLNTPGDLHPDVAQIFKDAGFVWGGNFKRLDFMHFQWAGF